MSNETGWYIAIFIMFVVTILIGCGLVYDREHRKSPCEYCYFEKAYDINGNEKIVWKGCKR